MTSITRFTLVPQTKQLKVLISENHGATSEQWSFSMEYLRVIDLTVLQSTLPNKSSKTPLVTNKKDVKLIAIESVGKHGFRLIFDDEFQQIYSLETFTLLHQQHDNLWQDYLDAVKASGFTRDSLIDIKAL